MTNYGELGKTWAGTERDPETARRWGRAVFPALVSTIGEIEPDKPEYRQLALPIDTHSTHA